MANSIDEDNLLVYHPKSAKIIFSVGKGVLSKATKIMSSLTQALTLFSDKVVNQNISYIRFQNHRMVFLNENDLYAIKLVQKDHLPKEYLPTMKIILGILSALLKSSSTLQKSEKQIKDLYRIFKHPDQALYNFSKSLDGYKTCLVFLAGLNFDLSINLESIRNNIIFSNPQKPKTIQIQSNIGIMSFHEDLKNSEVKDKINLNLEIDFPFLSEIADKTLNSMEIIQYLLGTESNATKIKDIINSEENLEEIIKMIIKVDSASAVEIAIQAIGNYNKEQGVGKTLYQLVVEKLNSIESQPKSETEELDNIGVSKEISESGSEPANLQQFEEEPKKIESLSSSMISENLTSAVNEIKTEKEQPISESIGSFSSLATEFTSKMKDLYETEELDSPSQLNISKQISDDITNEEMLNLNYEEEISNLQFSKFQFMMEVMNIYVDLKPFISGNLILENKIPYRPSLQIYTSEDYKTNIEIKIHPIRHNEFVESFKNFSDSEKYIFDEVGKGNFIIKCEKDEFPDLFRAVLWLMLIDYAYNIQQNILTPTEFFNQKNGSICIIPDGITPERKKHLPSNINEIIEEDSLLKDDNPISIVESLDAILLKIHSKLKAGKGEAIGFVPRTNSREISLILEFVLTLSELTGIGWSRW